MCALCQRDCKTKNRKRTGERLFDGFYSIPKPICCSSKIILMGKVTKSGPLARRPDNSAFKQQRLPAWSPMLTANTVLPFFYIMAVICMLLGVWLLLTVQSTQELKVSLSNSLIIIMYKVKCVAKVESFFLLR